MKFGVHYSRSITQYLARLPLYTALFQIYKLVHWNGILVTKMNIVPRQLFASSFSCCKAEAPLLYKARTAFSTTARPAAAQKRPAARSWVGRIQAGEKSRRGWNARFQHTWEQIQRVATSPKRSKLSNTAPLLAGIFGAAYIGSAFIPHDQEEDDPAESAVIIDAEQDEGKLTDIRTFNAGRSVSGIQC